jgi:hypothetical protein
LHSFLPHEYLNVKRYPDAAQEVDLRELGNAESYPFLDIVMSASAAHALDAMPQGGSGNI